MEDFRIGILEVIYSGMSPTHSSSWRLWCCLMQCAL